MLLRHAKELKIIVSIEPLSLLEDYHWRSIYLSDEESGGIVNVAFDFKKKRIVPFDLKKQKFFFAHEIGHIKSRILKIAKECSIFKSLDYLSSTEECLYRELSADIILGWQTLCINELVEKDD